MSRLQTVNFWLAVGITAAFIGIAVYCSWHGVQCWAATGFAVFFLLLSYFVLNLD